MMHARLIAQTVVGSCFEPVGQNRKVMWAEVPYDTGIGLVQPRFTRLIEMK